MPKLSIFQDGAGDKNSGQGPRPCTHFVTGEQAGKVLGCRSLISMNLQILFCAQVKHLPRWCGGQKLEAAAFRDR